MPDSLPHDPYIEAVVEALAQAGLPVDDFWTADNDTRGVYQYLDAVLTFEPDTSGLAGRLWPHGFVLIWEWHTGFEDGGPTVGPVWRWAELVDSHGVASREPEDVSVDGFADPASIVTITRELAASRKVESLHDTEWDQADALGTAVVAWSEKEMRR